MMKVFLSFIVVVYLTACSVKPQTLQVSPVLAFPQLSGVATPIELQVEDKRQNTSLLGYRNAKKEGPISFDDSLAKSVGISIQQAMEAQSILMKRQPGKGSILKVSIDELKYSSPNKDWVSHVQLVGEISIEIERGGAALLKRFSANKSQDVATAPSQEFNQNYLNTLLSDLLNKGFNDQEVVNFLK